MADIENSDDRIAVVGADSSLVFERSGDRWTHRIERALSPGGPREPIARAVEWEPDRDDPSRVVSPVYQEAHVHADPSGRPQVLLVGRAGAHHFSAVFTVDEPTGGIAVEVADRCRSAFDGWAATYTVLLPSGNLAAADPDRLAWEVDRLRLTLEPVAPAKLAMAEAGRSATRAQVVAAMNRAVGVAVTHVCHYNWTLRRAAEVP